MCVGTLTECEGITTVILAFWESCTHAALVHDIPAAAWAVPPEGQRSPQRPSRVTRVGKVVNEREIQAGRWRRDAGRIAGITPSEATPIANLPLSRFA